MVLGSGAGTSSIALAITPSTKLSKSIPVPQATQNHVRDWELQSNYVAFVQIADALTSRVRADCADCGCRN